MPPMKWHGISTRKRIAEVSMIPLKIGGIHAFGECLKPSMRSWCLKQRCVIALLIEAVRKKK